MPALDYSQVAGYDDAGLWIYLRDGSRRPWVQQWHLEDGGSVRLWKGKLADLPRIEATRWRIWQRVLRTSDQIAALIDRAAPPELKPPVPYGKGYLLPPGTEHVLCANHCEGDQRCYYSIRLRGDQPHGFTGPITERRLGYSFHWGARWRESGRAAELPEPSPEGQELHRLDFYRNGCWRRMHSMTCALTLAVMMRMGKGRERDKVRLHTHGREYWYECFAPGLTNPECSEHWRLLDAPEDRRVTLLDLDAEQPT
jgi:hypothetical protein